MSPMPPRQPVSRRRDHAAFFLLVFAAAGAALAFYGATASVSDAGASTRVVEIWRMFGFLVFSGLFLLLAWRPRLYAGVWELAMLDKIGLAVAGVLLGPAYVGAGSVAIVDGVVAASLITAYLLSKGYLAWGVAYRAGIDLGAGVEQGAAMEQRPDLYPRGQAPAGPDRAPSLPAPAIGVAPPDRTGDTERKRAA